MLCALRSVSDAGGDKAISTDEDDVRGRLVRNGDWVVVYETHDHMKSVKVEAGKIFQNRFGCFNQDEWIGSPFGSKVFSSGGRGRSQRGFVFLLKPTPELWTKVLKHRTQILYMPDIATIISSLNLSPGCTVLESGTGSGSLTHSLARAVAPTGKVFTFEFHQQRAEAARDEFKQNGLERIVKVEVRDIQGQGFPLHSAPADAVFLDLPGPWDAVASAALCLKPNGIICSFSPCIEQVQRCSQALLHHRFTDLRTLEVLLRTYDVHSAPQGSWRNENGSNGSADNRHLDEKSAPTKCPLWVRPALETKGHTGYLLFARLWV